MRLLHEIAIFQTVKSKVIMSLFETVRSSVSTSLRNLYNSLNSIKEISVCNNESQLNLFLDSISNVSLTLACHLQKLDLGIFSSAGKLFLAHQIRISACFTCTYKSDLTQDRIRITCILCIGCIGSHVPTSSSDV